MFRHQETFYFYGFSRGYTNPPYFGEFDYNNSFLLGPTSVPYETQTESIRYLDSYDNYSVHDEAKYLTHHNGSIFYAVGSFLYWTDPVTPFLRKSGNVIKLDLDITGLYSFRGNLVIFNKIGIFCSATKRLKSYRARPCKHFNKVFSNNFKL